MINRSRRFVSQPRTRLPALMDLSGVTFMNPQYHIAENIWGIQGGTMHTIPRIETHISHQAREPRGRLQRKLKGAHGADTFLTSSRFQIHIL